MTKIRLFLCVLLTGFHLEASEPGAPGKPQGMMRFDCDDVWQWPEEVGSRADYQEWYAEYCDECQAESDQIIYKAWKLENCRPDCSKYREEISQLESRSTWQAFVDWLSGENQTHNDKLNAARSELNSCTGGPVEAPDLMTEAA